MHSRTALALLFALCACQSVEEATHLGRFRVTATRTSMTCGPQSMEFAPRVEYNVDLKVREGTMTWEVPGLGPNRGSWNGFSRTFRVLLEQDQVMWPYDRRRQLAGCTLRRTDVIEAEVEMADGDAGNPTDASAPDAGDAGVGATARGFRGVETIVFGSTPDTQCGPLVGASAGQFSTLPCEVTYALTARRL